MRGSTLIEMLCVLGMFSVFASFSAYVGVSAFQRSQVGSDAQLAAGALRLARAAAMHRECADVTCTSTSHGVYLSNNSVTTFEGFSYAGRLPNEDTTFPISSKASSTETIFGRGGYPTAELSLPIGTWHIRVESDGTVSMENEM